jgi:hypothetical protein
MNALLVVELGLSKLTFLDLPLLRIWGLNLYAGRFQATSKGTLAPNL